MDATEVLARLLEMQARGGRMQRGVPHLFMSMPKAEGEPEKLEEPNPCFPLPFYLQDLCLLVVVDNLSSYSMELLVSLPYWLRHRLLSCLPALELSRLEYTPLAKGVYTDAIWQGRLREPDTPEATIAIMRRMFLSRPPEDDDDSPFQLNVCRNRRSDVVLSSEDLRLIHTARQPLGHHFLLKPVSDLLCESYGTGMKSIHQLISIPGDILLSNMVTDSTHQRCYKSTCKEGAWRRQVTPLVVKSRGAIPHSYCIYSQDRMLLTPHYLMPFYQKPDSVAMLSSLLEGCQLHPSSANVLIDNISHPFLSGLLAERFALDSGLSLPTEDLKFTLIIQSLLRKVVVLSLKCDKYSLIGVMISVIKAAIADGQDSQLKHLFCALPDVYIDIVEPLSSLFSLQNFNQLTIDLREVYPLMLSRLLQAFLKAPCQHPQKLRLNLSRGLQLPKWITKSQLASIDVSGANMPSCSYKIFECSSQSDFTNSLNLLLQFSTLRLREVALVKLSENYEYFHLCAIHPDLQTTKLVIEIDDKVTSRDSRFNLATVQEDFISLFKMPSLQMVVVRGNWSHLTEVKLGLALGLQYRSQRPPLTDLSLELVSARSYEVIDFRMLCDAIFSLPRLENLQLVLGKGFSDLIKRRNYEEALYNSWSQKGSNIQLKSICLQISETKLEQLPLCTRNVSFSYKPRSFYGNYEDFSDSDQDDSDDNCDD